MFDPPNESTGVYVDVQVCSLDYSLQVGLWPDMSQLLSERSSLHRNPQLDAIVRRINQILLRAKVALSSLH
jgi:hypothetical protein